MITDISKLLNQENEDPQYLDEISIEHSGYKIHVYGILHGVSGGTNQEYRELVNNTILQSNGLKFGEKGMKSFYKGIAEELDDWNVVKLKDIIRLTLSVHGLPLRTFGFLKILLTERLTKTDKFKKDKTIGNLGGSPQFHLLDHEIRRKLAGFPESPDYLEINLQRWQGINKFKLAPAFDPDWRWLNWIEPYANLPLRSIWMIEYALEYARLKNVNEISLFIGETHNTDIKHYLENKNKLIKNTTIKGIVNKAKITANLKLQHKFNIGSLKYIAGIMMGMSVPAIYYSAIILLIMHTF